MHDEQNFSYKNVQINKSSNKVDNETVFHNYSPHASCFKEDSNDLNENIINIPDESNNSSTLEDDFEQRAMKRLFTTTVNRFLISTLIPNLTCVNM